MTPELSAHDVVSLVQWALGVFVTIQLAFASGILALWRANHNLEQRLTDRMDREVDSVAQKRDDLVDGVWRVMDAEIRPHLGELIQAVAVLKAAAAARGGEVDKHATRLVTAHYGSEDALRALENDGAERLETRQLDIIRLACEAAIANPEADPKDVASATMLLQRVRTVLVLREQFYGGVKTEPAVPRYAAQPAADS